jgi:hypothetical protein
MQQSDFIPFAEQKVKDRIIELNRGSYPCSLRQWLRIARKCGLTVKFANLPVAFLATDLIVCPRSHRFKSRVIAHEVAEYLMRTECQPPIYYPLSYRYTRHQVAKRCEE